jgi:hypothetical protein
MSKAQYNPNTNTDYYNLKDAFFYQTPEKYTQIQGVRDFLESNAIWKWVPKFYVHDWDNFPCPENLVLNDPFLSAVNLKFGGALRFFKIPAEHLYNWHHDFKTTCCFNMILKKYNSHTLFSLTETQEHLDKFIEVDYVPEQWVLFNTKKKHLVINFEKEDRYLISYRFIDVTYDTVLEWYNKVFLKTL